MDSTATVKLKKQEGVFILDNEKPKWVAVKTGLNGGGYVAIEGDVHPGQPVIIGMISRKNSAQENKRSPLGGGQARPRIPRRM